MSRQLIPIFFSVDDNYAPYLSVAVTSLVSNASKNYDYEIVVMSDDLSDSNVEKLKTLETENFKFRFVSMEGKLKEITDRTANRLCNEFFTLTIYFRILIPVMFPEYDKGIYIDSDITVPGDISELYNTDLEGNLIGACIDYSIHDVPPFMDYIHHTVVDNQWEYFNSGVLLMDLKKLREVKVDERFIELLTKYHFDTVAPDQDYLNSMCYGKVKFIGEEWDAMPKEDLAKAVKNPKLIHYNLFTKPWLKSGIMYEEYFWEYAKMSPYYKQILATKDSLTPEQIEENDRIAMAMVKTAVRIQNENEVTFKSVFDSGLEPRL